MLNQGSATSIEAQAVADARRWLIELGDTLEAVGPLDAQLGNAIRSFQAENGLAVTGIPDDNTLTALRVVTAYLSKKEGQPRIADLGAGDIGGDGAEDTNVAVVEKNTAEPHVVIGGKIIKPNKDKVRFIKKINIEVYDAMYEFFIDDYVYKKEYKLVRYRYIPRVINSNPGVVGDISNCNGRYSEKVRCELPSFLKRKIVISGDYPNFDLEVWTSSVSYFTGSGIAVKYY